MAEVLIKAIDATHPDPAKQARGCYRMGDPVVVMPDGHEWGREEGLPRFWLLRIPGVSVSQVEAFLERGEGRRREWNLAPSDVPAGARTQLLATGVLTVTPAQAQAFIKRKAAE